MRSTRVEHRALQTLDLGPSSKTPANRQLLKSPENSVALQEEIFCHRMQTETNVNLWALHECPSVISL